MPGTSYSYLSPKLTNQPHKNKGSCGVFAMRPVKKGELLVLWGGKILTEAELDPSMPEFTQRVLQNEEGLYLFSLAVEPADCFNHSCDPNAGFSGQIGLVAMRDIRAAEEICFDYAMCDTDDYDEFVCACGTSSCRGLVTGADWKHPEVQSRYAGWFSSFIARKIAESVGAS